MLSGPWYPARARARSSGPACDVSVRSYLTRLHGATGETPPLSGVRYAGHTGSDPPSAPGDTGTECVSTETRH